MKGTTDFLKPKNKLDRNLKKEQLPESAVTSLPITRSSFAEIPRSLKFLPFKIRQIIKNEPKVLIKYQTSKLPRFQSFYIVKIYNTFQNARTGNVTNQPTQIWEFVKDNNSKQYIGTKRTPFNDPTF